VVRAAPELRLATNVHAVPTNSVTVSPTDGGGIQPQFSVTFATYLGGPGADIYTRIKYRPTGMYLAGSATDPMDPTALDLTVAKITIDGTTLLQFGRFNFGHGTKFWSRGLDVAADGTVYVDGFTGANEKNTSGMSNFYVVSIRPDFSATNWVVTFQDPTQRAAGYGLKLDGGGANLYYNGDFDLSRQSLPRDNLLMGKLTNLPQPMPTTVYSNIFTFVDTHGLPTPTVVPVVAGASGVGPDTVGDADFVTNINDGMGDIQPLFGQLAPDGSHIIASFSVPSVGQSGLGTDITVDAGNNYVFTGSARTAGANVNGLLIGKATQANQVLFLNAFFFTGPLGPLNSFGTGVREDGMGQVFTSASNNDPARPPNASYTLEAYKFSADGSMVLDGTNGALHGSRNDYGLGLDLPSVGPDGEPPPDASNVYVVGASSSPDFPTTPGGLQTNYGGGPTDGVVACMILD
jgi:hypothetical protein